MLIPIVAVAVLAGCSAPKSEMPPEPPKPQAVEFGDSTRTAVCKEGLMALSSGDIDAFGTALADNAVYQWNAGDSVAGKAAIIDYWKDRRGNVIDKLEITNDIWLSLRVNESKQVKPADYVFLWSQVTASYKGGKSMTQWIHNIYRFDNTGKIDRITQFLDRAPIMAAMPPAKK